MQSLLPLARRWLRAVCPVRARSQPCVSLVSASAPPPRRWHWRSAGVPTADDRCVCSFGPGAELRKLLLGVCPSGAGICLVEAVGVALRAVQRAGRFLFRQPVARQSLRSSRGLCAVCLKGVPGAGLTRVAALPRQHLSQKGCGGLPHLDRMLGARARLEPWRYMAGTFAPCWRLAQQQAATAAYSVQMWLCR